ncbi:MAG TPA: DNA polymerase ligase N-terminal domain-containing protein [Nitrospiria bacterium]|nr:DNA polymerase ligase N-terminal domain-containing protein [Nitrospiria bacterium]
MSRRSSRFVVHEHEASHLHFDVRLEIGDSFKSWAVPKGPSMNPAEKRLAVRVDDHPLEYGDFEGIIPEGHYGAGAVVIWDKGTFTPLDDPETGLAGGRLAFRLQGRRLKGEFALVRMKRGGNGKEWLLVKKADAFADLSWRLMTALTPAKRRSLRVREPACDAS